MMQQNIPYKNKIDLEFDSPLADKLRPKTLDEFYGQQQILNKNSLLYNSILNDMVGNTILSGPPGVGKTTLVEIISCNTRSVLVKLNAVLSGIKELRNEIELAKSRWQKSKRKTILFIDEVHRFNSIQQDALLPSIENGTISFIGATTENPFFAVNKALLSRSRQFTFKPLDEDDMKKIIEKVITYFFNLDNSKKVELSEEAAQHLINFSNGDARHLINALELAIGISKENKNNIIEINLKVAEDAIQNKKINYDKNGQNHFDTISAFIKSIRGSDPDATLYWLASMLAAGEDPNFIFRRLLIASSEDVGLANPNAIIMINTCREAFQSVGSPEGYYFLSQASLYLALSPKSNSTKSIFTAIANLKNYPITLVPDHLRNNSTTYKNPLIDESSIFEQSYMPEAMKDHKLWNPSDAGWEKKKVDERKGKN
tara:strand:- start:502 stop:1788 length:1287 start_codon:yes stop_codon:yes gene_type:complete